MVRRFKRAIARFGHAEEGLSTLEYVILGAIILGVVMTVVPNLATVVSNAYNTMSAKIATLFH